MCHGTETTTHGCAKPPATRLTPTAWLALAPTPSSGTRPVADSLLAHPWRSDGRLLRLDDRRHSTGADDDDPRAGLVLRRHEPLEVRSQQVYDFLSHAGRRRLRLRAVGLVGVVRRRLQRRRQAV